MAPLIFRNPAAWNCRKQGGGCRTGHQLPLNLLLLFLGLFLFWVPTATSAAENVRQLSLKEVFRTTLASHQRIEAAHREVVKSNLLPGHANTLMFPRITLYGRAYELDSDITFEPRVGPFSLSPVTVVPDEQLQANFSYKQPLYTGTYFVRRQQAGFVIDRSEAEYRQTVQEVLFQVAQVYYEIMTLRELIVSTEDDLGLAAEEKRIAQVRFQEGSITEDVVLGIDLKTSAAQARLVGYRNQLQVKEKLLARIMGEDLGAISLQLPPSPSLTALSTEELIATARRNRHDYLAAQARVKIAGSEIELVKARFHPSLEGSWDYYVIDQPAYDQDDNYWVAALLLKIPLLEGGSRFYDLSEKRESFEQARLLVEDLEDRISSEVEQAVSILETDRSLLASLEIREGLARKNYDILFSKFEHGAATNVDLNQAFQTLQIVKRDRSVKQYEYALAILQLEMAAGTFGHEFLAE